MELVSHRPGPDTRRRDRRGAARRIAQHQECPVERLRQSWSIPHHKITPDLNWSGVMPAGTAPSTYESRVCEVAFSAACVAVSRSSRSSHASRSTSCQHEGLVDARCRRSHVGVERKPGAERIGRRIPGRSDEHVVRSRSRPIRCPGLVDRAIASPRHQPVSDAVHHGNGFQDGRLYRGAIGPNVPVLRRPDRVPVACEADEEVGGPKASGD